MARALDGFVRVAAVSPTVRVADCEYNAGNIIEAIKQADADGVSVLCLPELSVTGYTCGDLFLQDELLRGAEAALSRIARACSDARVLAFIGVPLARGARLFNTVAAMCGSRILGVVPKLNLPNYGEFYELRHFSPAPRDNGLISVCGNDVPFGMKLIFRCDTCQPLKIAAELCEDLWAPNPPSVSHAVAGATVIVNASASDETIGKAEYRRTLIGCHSARLVCGYVYTNAGHGESTTDMTFAGHNIICENGALLAESQPFGGGRAVTEIDLRAIENDRRRMNTFPGDESGYETISFSLDVGVSSPRRRIDPHPFVPSDESEKRVRCEAILDMQSAGLQKRLEHTKTQTAVIGVSGGLDSSLALIVTARAFAKLGRDLSGVLALTMPCFGTTSRTKSNALRLCEALGVSCIEADITETARAALRDAGHSEDARDTTYENAQARVRTLLLMNTANKRGGLVIGTGDLSELALGWATYNGDHMSMYGVNAGVPKTLVRHIVGYVAESTPALRDVLNDILATPVSPELLPPEEDGISQRTESIVGPYELHDFFLYHTVRRGRTPKSVLSLANIAFEGAYNPAEIKKWLEVFYKRFFAQQFKRSCLPDGPKIGSVTLSPRGDWRMPSDASCGEWLKDLE
ncbi:NAD(+) synthase [Synergistales bacterium]|nr:NAD(+) synthase [Synergistales bacterium]